MSAMNADRGLLTPQGNPLSKPRAVYSIDQILGNHHRRSTINGNLFDFTFAKVGKLSEL